MHTWVEWWRQFKCKCYIPAAVVDMVVAEQPLLEHNVQDDLPSSYHSKNHASTPLFWAKLHVGRAPIRTSTLAFCLCLYLNTVHKMFRQVCLCMRKLQSIGYRHFRIFSWVCIALENPPKNGMLDCPVVHRINMIPCHTYTVTLPPQHPSIPSTSLAYTDPHSL